jgi:hypothetical protein
MTPGVHASRSGRLRDGESRTVRLSVEARQVALVYAHLPQALSLLLGKLLQFAHLASVPSDTLHPDDLLTGNAPELDFPALAVTRERK